MRRNNSVGSIVGIAFTGLLFVGMLVTLWRDRGLVFSPGHVSAKSKDGVVIKGYASHADFEKQCSNCHDPSTTTLAEKCLECHMEIEQEIATAQGIHSQLTGVYQCSSCHPEHQGKDFDPTKAAFRLFDHSSTRFSLNWHQINYDASPMACAACHQNDSDSIVENQTCLDCHTNDDKSFSSTHTSDYGGDCHGCHDGSDRMSTFEHSQTGYTLEGKHQNVKCSSCHTADSVSSVSTDCKYCHNEPAQHLNIFESNCKNCHTAQGWSPAQLNGEAFGHLTTTGFSLALHQSDYANQPMTCASCHSKDLQVLEVQTCVDCHTQHDAKFMADHQEQFGSECLTCHDGADRLSSYDHNNFFVLDGKHADLQCNDCHVDKLYRGTASECSQCHEEPEIHADVFGLNCVYCHGREAWSPATLKQHDFPINHGLADQSLQLTCDTCHGPNYIGYSCYSCHDHQEQEILQSHLDVGIAEQDFPSCANCHLTGKVDTSQQAP
jgi:hypothetical protein